MITKTDKLIIMLMGLAVLFISVFVWLTTSQTVDDFFLLRDRDTESDLAIAFTVALRMNHSAAYKMIDGDLTPRLDEWMETHQVPNCTRRINLLSGGVGPGISVYYACNTEDNRWYRLKVDEIVIEDMKVVNWGDVSEE